MFIAGDLGGNQGFGILFQSADTAQGANDSNQSSSDQPNTISSTDTASAAGPRNVLESNFFNSKKESSRYVQGIMIGLQVDNDFSSKMQGIVSNYQLEAAQTDSYAEKNLMGKKAEDAVEDAVQNEVGEESEDVLKETREDIEEKAEQAGSEAEAAEDTQSAESGKDAQGASNDTGADEQSAQAADAATPASYTPVDVFV